MKDKQLIPVKSMDIKLDNASLLMKAKETGFMKRIRKFSPIDFHKISFVLWLSTLQPALRHLPLSLGLLQDQPSPGNHSGRE